MITGSSNLHELADLHNRRSNISTVARQAQINLYPLLTWPEDKALLRLSDLPLIQGRRPNIPAPWSNVRAVEARTFTSDSAFRDWLTIGRAYYRSLVHHSGLTVVVAMEVTTYGG